MIFLWMVALLAWLLVGAGTLRRLPAWVAAVFWLVVPLVLLPVWLANSAEHHWSWFLWTKTWSVVLACLWLAVCGARPRMHSKTVAISMWLFLGVNILEAVAADLAGGRVANAVAGVLLILAMLRVESPSMQQDAGRWRLAFPLGWPWVAAYSVWNICFVVGAFPFAGGQHLVVLTAALLLAARHGPQAWLEARAMTLGLHLLVYDALFGTFMRDFNTASWAVEGLHGALSVLSVMGATVVLGWTLLQWRRGVRSIGTGIAGTSTNVG